MGDPPPRRGRQECPPSFRLLHSSLTTLHSPPGASPQHPVPRTKNPAPSIKIIGPGILVAATGVGAGDLATAGFAGSQLGTTVLWAVLVGAFFKFVLTEGLTRWQLATGSTLLEGTALKLGRLVGWLFIPYFLLWTFFVGSALISACGVTLYAILAASHSPLATSLDPDTAKIIFGILSSLAGLLLILRGGFQLFQKIMGFCIGIMFLTVVASALVLMPAPLEILKGVTIPRIPDFSGSGLSWTIALMGGVGGTVTILCYGYWISEVGRTGRDSLRICRIDLATGYGTIAIFGMALVIIGSTANIEGSGVGLIVSLADSLQSSLGQTGRWLFLIGAFGAVFSSLLGVWQAAPYLFADTWNLFVKQPSTRRETGSPMDRPALHSPGSGPGRSLPYRFYLFAIAIVPMLGLIVQFKEIQKIYAIIGAAFIPMLAALLLLLNGRRKWVGTSTNRPSTVLALVVILLFFGWIAWRVWIPSP